MNMFTSSELATTTRKVCDAARTQGCALITTNGKADLAMIDLSGFESINDFVHVFDQWRASAALRRLRSQALGIDMSFEDIEAEIAQVRKDSKSAKSAGATR